MAQYTQHFFVEGRHLGEAERTVTFNKAELEAPRSYAFFCPCCGELWSYCPVTKVSTGALREFFVWTRPCRKHVRSSQEVAGSLWLSWEKDFVEAFPREVLLREFELHTKSLPEVL